MGKSRTISKINWSWDYGKVVSEITCTDGVTQIRNNDKRPPTYPAHDIAHFICGFHEDYDWDYLWDQHSESLINVRLAEYNAVFMENLLYIYITNKYKNSPRTTLQLAEPIKKHLNWFVKDYYKFITSELKLRKIFLSKLDENIVCQHYQTYHDVCLLQLKTPPGEDVRDIKLALTMDSSLDQKNTEVYDYITEMKTILGN